MLKLLATLAGWLDAFLRWRHDQGQQAQGAAAERVNHEDRVKADVAVAAGVRNAVAEQLRADPAALRAHDEFERPGDQ